MANARVGNTIHIDSTGSVTTDRNTRVVGIFFTPDANNDEVMLYETSGGPMKLHLRSSVGKLSQFYRLVDMPIIFGNGIYVGTITSGAHVCLIVSQSSGDI